VAALGERTHFLVWWVLKILWRSQHVSLFSESREILRMSVVNISAVLQEWWLILYGEFSIFMFELFLVLTKYVLISSSRSNCAITVHYKCPTLLTLLLHYVAAMPFVSSGKWKGGAASLPEDWERRRTWINPNYFQTLCTHISEYKNYMFFCCFLQLN
jgi:hypothetical protein